MRRKYKGRYIALLMAVVLGIGLVPNVASAESEQDIALEQENELNEDIIPNLTANDPAQKEQELPKSNADLTAQEDQEIANGLPVMQATEKCTCTSLCTDEGRNAECLVCGAEGALASACGVRNFKINTFYFPDGIDKSESGISGGEPAIFSVPGEGSTPASKTLEIDGFSKTVEIKADDPRKIPAGKYELVGLTLSLDVNESGQLVMPPKMASMTISSYPVSGTVKEQEDWDKSYAERAINAVYVPAQDQKSEISLTYQGVKFNFTSETDLTGSQLVATGQTYSFESVVKPIEVFTGQAVEQVKPDEFVGADIQIMKGFKWNGKTYYEGEFIKYNDANYMVYGISAEDLVVDNFDKNGLRTIISSDGQIKEYPSIRGIYRKDKYGELCTINGVTYRYGYTTGPNTNLFTRYLFTLNNDYAGIYSKDYNRNTFYFKEGYDPESQSKVGNMPFIIAKINNKNYEVNFPFSGDVSIVDGNGQKRENVSGNMAITVEAAAIPAKAEYVLAAHLAGDGVVDVAKVENGTANIPVSSTSPFMVIALTEDVFETPVTELIIPKPTAEAISPTLAPTQSPTPAEKKTTTQVTSPDTGDDIPFGFWWSMLCVCASIGCVSFVRYKKISR
ncbi:MAG: hypothetical protein EOM40_10825 [Clostridia bacterium]|nr:hypothetical protein [Clostridia bacterium]NCC44246.1 hypothetical protein [Clostridia bacterium]